MVACWCVFMMAALKSLSENSNMCALCVLASLDSPLIPVVIFPVFGDSVGLLIVP